LLVKGFKGSIVGPKELKRLWNRRHRASCRANLLPKFNLKEKKEKENPAIVYEGTLYKSSKFK
jgi:hypothetical protein